MARCFGKCSTGTAFYEHPQDERDVLNDGSIIVDAHTHTPSHRTSVPTGEVQVNHAWRPDRSVVSTVTWEDHARAVAAADVSIVFNIAVADPETDVGLPGETVNVNDATAAFVADDPGHRIGFLSVHPDHPAAMDELERCVDDLGLKGIKLGANYQRFEPLGRNARRIYAWAERHGLPIMFHTGASPIRHAPLAFAHPLVIDEVAIAYPDLRMVMAHMGHPWHLDTFVVIRKHPHVYADVSSQFFRPWQAYQGLRLATEWNVLDKLLLGSDFPVATTSETISGLRSVNGVTEGTGLPRVPEVEIETIITRDTLTRLGLIRPIGADHKANSRQRTA